MTDSASQVFRNLVKNFPKTPDYRYHLALALLQKGDKDGARRELRTCLQQHQPQQQTQRVTELLASLH
jgi:TolA-binding protein